jgi:hypothetical protein
MAVLLVVVARVVTARCEHLFSYAKFYTGNFTHVDDSPVEDRDLGKPRTIAQAALRLMSGLNFGWKAFCDSNRDDHV